MRPFVLAAALFAVPVLAAFPVAAYAQTQDEAPAAAPAPAAPTPVQAAYSVDRTPIGVLLDTPALKAIFAKHFPKAVTDPRIAQARNMTVRQLQAFAPTVFTNEKLAAMDADLAMATAQ